MVRGCEAMQPAVSAAAVSQTAADAAADAHHAATVGAVAVLPLLNMLPPLTLPLLTWTWCRRTRGTASCRCKAPSPTCMPQQSKHIILTGFRVQDLGVLTCTCTPAFVVALRPKLALAPHRFVTGASVFAWQELSLMSPTGLESNPPPQTGGHVSNMDIMPALLFHACTCSDAAAHVPAAAAQQAAPHASYTLLTQGPPNTHRKGIMSFICNT